ncbi:M60 family metallopeptidase [Vibrio sp. NTOU-M3]|uniref:M60 family metallopeptidase n=1 Tax=Vibrio sp. NTOU-M3 TaxID=3234954 RepID=UPI00349FBBA9
MKVNFISQSLLFALSTTSSFISVAAEPSREVTVEQRWNSERYYQEQRRLMKTHPIQSSGFWADANDELVISYEYQGIDIKDKPQVWIVPIQYRDQIKSSPQKVTLKPGQNTIKVREKGVIYYAPMSPPSDRSLTLKMESGGREMPRFILNRDTDAEWQNMLSRYNSSPYGELVGERMILTLPMSHMNKISNPTEIMATWDRIVSLAEEQYGLDEQNNPPNSGTKLQYMFQSKPDDTPGYMSASHFWLGTNERGFYDVTTELSNSWGPWHELGHHYQMPFMTWNGLTEVTVNLTSLYVQRELQGVSRLNDVWPRAQTFFNTTEKYNDSNDLFMKVGMFWQLDLAFGKDFYARLGRHIRSLENATFPYAHDQRQQAFILESSRVSGFDLTPFFEKWKLEVTPETKQQILALNLAKLDKPIWNNTDENKAYVYPLSQQNINAEIVLPKSVSVGETFTVTANVTNRTQADELDYQFEVPTGFELLSQQGNSVILKAPESGLVHNAISMVRVNVSDGVRTFPAANGTRVFLPNRHQSNDSYLIDLMKSKYEVSDIKEWDHADSIWGDRQTAKVGEIYKYARGSGLYFYQLVKSPYYYFPFEASSDPNNSWWKEVGRFDLRTHYDKSEISVNNKPVAMAGDDMTVTTPAEVVLSGEKSYDPDGDSLTYLWQQVSGEKVTLSNPTAPRMTVQLPELSSDQQYVFSLAVSDGSATSRDEVVITAKSAAEVNQPPQVSLNPLPDVKAGESVEIMATASDADGDQLEYQWQTSGLVYTSLAKDKIRIMAPTVEADTDYTISVTVTDGKGGTHSSSTRLNVLTSNDSCSVSDPAAGSYESWSVSKTYNTGDIVSYNQLVWQAQYWTKGNQPDTSDAWALLSDVALPWDASTAYSGGDEVTYEGHQYQAQWWTRGEVPGSAPVWTKTGNACQ